MIKTIIVCFLVALLSSACGMQMTASTLSEKEAVVRESNALKIWIREVKEKSLIMKHKRQKKSSDSIQVKLTKEKCLEEMEEVICDEVFAY